MTLPKVPGGPAPEQATDQPNGSSAPPPEPRGTPPDAVARQRWRLYLRIPAAAGPGELPSGAGGWTSVFEAGTLPLVALGSSRGRVAPAAQLPLGVAGEREIVDVVLHRMLSVADVRESVRAALPGRIELVDLHDVWLGAPAAAAAIRAADYRIELGGPSPADAAVAAGRLLAAATLLRARRREKRSTEYDLRPLLIHLMVESPASETRPGCTAIIRARLRHGVDGVGRPDELLAALSETPAGFRGGPPTVLATTRDRFLLEDDPDLAPDDARRSPGRPGTTARA